MVLTFLLLQLQYNVSACYFCGHNPLNITGEIPDRVDWNKDSLIIIYYGWMHYSKRPYKGQLADLYAMTEFISLFIT